MARTQGTKIENNFAVGLVTETTELKYPRNSCVDADNVIIDKLGVVSRRKPIDIENSVQTAANLGYTLSADQINYPVLPFLWTSVGGDGNKSFLVIQQGNILNFYDVSANATNVRDNIKGFTVLLDTYIVSGSSLLSKNYPCSFANGRGKLIVVNKAIDPIKISYDAVADSITVSTFAVKFRDFQGVPSTIAIDSRPTASVATITTSNPAHLYNLYNAGWGLTDALSQWDTARADLPSLCDTTGTFRASETDAFDNTKVGPKSNGNSLAPRGHFVISLGLEERSGLSGVDVGGSSSSIGFADAVVSQQFTQSGYSGLTSSATSVPIAISNMNDTNQSTTTMGQLAVTKNPSGAVGSGVFNWQISKTFASPKKIFSVVTKSGPAIPFFNTSFASGSGTLPTFSAGTIKIYGVVGALSLTLGTLLATVNYTNVANESIVLVSSDNVTAYDHVQIVYTVATNAYTQSAAGVCNIQLRPATFDVFEALNSATANTRPETVAFYAGRVWYASPGYNEKGSQLFFSQVIEREDQYGSCYQVNDPTSEYFFDLLASDGGTVSIPELANVVGLFAMRSALVVLATNGIWVIRGNSAEGFSATSYRVEKVTSMGCVSRYSICDMKGLPVWMGEDGIYTLEYDPNYNAFQLKSLSDERVRSYFKDTVSADAKRYSRIVYDVTEQILRIAFTSASTITSGQEFYFDKMMNYDVNSKAWYTFTFGTTLPLIGIVNVVDANHVYPSRLKFIFRSNHIDSVDKSYFGEFKDTTVHQDFTTYASSSRANNSALLYVPASYVVTAPTVDAEAMKFFQSNYIMVFLNTVTNAACKLQGQFDWTSSGSSGKWSTSQEVYTTINLSRLGYRKLKLRGKGRALSLKFSSSGTAPFEIIGWAIYETANAGV